MSDPRWLQWALDPHDREHVVGIGGALEPSELEHAGRSRREAVAAIFALDRGFCTGYELGRPPSPIVVRQYLEERLCVLCDAGEVVHVPSVPGAP
jgi:hypothetical protein